MANKREFSRDEIQDIFRRAAERQKNAHRTGGGLTLDELRRIGEESGLDPAHVEAAAREIERGGVVPAKADLETPEQLTGVEHFYGLPATARIAQVLPGRMDDATWRDAVDVMESVFQNEGESTVAGPMREWQLSSSLAIDYRMFSESSTPGDWLRMFDSMSNPTRGLVTVETHPEGDGTHVEMSYAMPMGRLWEGPGLTGLFLAIGLVTIVVYLVVGEMPILIAPLVMMLLATGLGLYTRIAHRNEILETRERMEKAMTKIRHLQAARVTETTGSETTGSETTAGETRSDEKTAGDENRAGGQRRDAQGSGESVSPPLGDALDPDDAGEEAEPESEGTRSSSQRTRS